MNLVDFLVNVLGIPKSVGNGGAVEKIRRLGPTRFFNDEVLVVFKEVSVRDTVIGRSGMLSEMHDKVTKRSTAGIRVDIPGFLRGEEKILEEYGRRIRSKHGKGTKHHIKFDDGEMTVFLNIRKAGDANWSRVYPENAREWVQRLRREDAEAVNRNFNLSKPNSYQNAKVNLSGGSVAEDEGDSGQWVSGRGGGAWGEGNGKGGQPFQQRKVASWTGRAGSATDMS